MTSLDSQESTGCNSPIDYGEAQENTGCNSPIDYGEAQENTACNSPIAGGLTHEANSCTEKNAVLTYRNFQSFINELLPQVSIGDVFAFVGPTASGKSALAEEFARAVDGEIISADSMQVYRGMDIGTAKVPLKNRGVPYHCLDLVNPGEPFSVALYQQYARQALSAVQAKGKVPIVCGGSGLYVRAALDDMRFPKGEQVNNATREQYSKLANSIGSDRLHQLLTDKDPKSAQLIHPNNVRRVIRAFELLEEGTSYYEQHTNFKSIKPQYDARFFAIELPVDSLYSRIDARVDTMFESGLFEEVSLLLEKGFREGLTAPQAIGYKELVPTIEQGFSKDSEQCKNALDAIRQSTRRYAKRQRTWFRAEKRINWIRFEQ